VQKICISDFVNILIIKKSNIALQNAITKYGLDKFNFCVYEYFTFKSKIMSSKALTDLETNYISKFKFDTIYNFKVTATSMLEYRQRGKSKNVRVL